MEIHIADIRYEKMVSLRQLSALTGISKTTLNDIENSKVSPTIHQLEKIAKALHVRIRDLIKSEYL